MQLTSLPPVAAQTTMHELSRIVLLKSSGGQDYLPISIFLLFPSFLQR